MCTPFPTPHHRGVQMSPKGPLNYSRHTAKGTRHTDLGLGRAAPSNGCSPHLDTLPHPMGLQLPTSPMVQSRRPNVRQQTLHCKAVNGVQTNPVQEGTQPDTRQPRAPGQPPSLGSGPNPHRPHTPRLLGSTHPSPHRYQLRQRRRHPKTATAAPSEMPDPSSPRDRLHPAASHTGKRDYNRPSPLSNGSDQWEPERNISILLVF